MIKRIRPFVLILSIVFLSLALNVKSDTSIFNISNDKITSTKLTIEDIEKIDNFTIREFVKYYYITGDDLEQKTMLDDISEETRVIVIGEAEEGKFPMIGTSTDGTEGIVGSIETEDQTIVFDTRDHTKSATVKEIKDALNKYF